MITYYSIMINRLKKGWISNRQACDYLGSGEGGRIIRKIRQYMIPAGYEMKEKVMKVKSNKNRRTSIYKCFRLMKAK